MTYIRGQNKELDTVADGLQKYISGFYPGCTLEVVTVQQAGWKQHIGKRFKSTDDLGRLMMVLDNFDENYTCHLIDPKNTYSINYSRENLKVVDDISYMSEEELVKEIALYYPGFYIGCTMEVIKLPSTKGSSYIGATFSTKGLEKKRLEDTVNQLRKGRSFIIDPHNTYCANYTKETLQVLQSDVSLGYRIKTTAEMISEFGSLSNVPSTFTSGMSHLAGKPIKDDLARKLTNGCQSSIHSNKHDFLNPIDGAKYNWAISSAMITNAPLPLSEDPVFCKSGGLVFGKFDIHQIVVSTSEVRGYRKEGQLFEVLPNSDHERLYYQRLNYLDDVQSSAPDEWRAATKEEAFYYYKVKGIKKEVLISGMSDTTGAGYTYYPDIEPSSEYHDSDSKKDSALDCGKPEKSEKDSMFISDFTTAQLRVKNKRPKLSIN